MKVMLKCLVLRVGTIVSFPKWDAISRNVLVVAKNVLVFFVVWKEETNERRRLYLDTFDKKRIQNIRYLVTTKNYLILTIDTETRKETSFFVEKSQFSSSIFFFVIYFCWLKIVAKRILTRLERARGVFFYRTSLLIAVCTSGPLSSFGIFSWKEKIHQMEERWALKSIANVSFTETFFLSGLHA